MKRLSSLSGSLFRSVEESEQRYKKQALWQPSEIDRRNERQRKY